MRMTKGWRGHQVRKTVTVNGPPTVEFDFEPASPLAGQEVAFSAEVSDPEDDPVSLAWDFGDGDDRRRRGPAPCL